MAIQYVDRIADAAGTLVEPFIISGTNNQFSISVDGGANQVITLTSGTRTAAQIVTDLSTLTGCTASVVPLGPNSSLNVVRIRTTSALGASSTILFNAPSNNSNAVLGFVATTYTGGANVAPLIVGDTKTNLANRIQTALTDAGWIVVSGSFSSSIVMLSSLTPSPQNLRMRITITTTNTNCVNIISSNFNGTRSGGSGTNDGGMLLPATNRTFMVLANKYQAFIMEPGSVVCRTFVAFGVPYVPAFLAGVVWEASWLHGNAQSDTDTGAGVVMSSGPMPRPSFRQFLGLSPNYGFSQSGPAQQSICNGSVWTGASLLSGQGQQSLFTTVSHNVSQNFPNIYAPFHNRAAIVSTPLIGWGTASATDFCRIKGQLWDAVILSDPFPMDTQYTIDSNLFVAITHNNNNTHNLGVNGGSTRGTLFVRRP